jgi:mRNA-degrading endonuclease RelE of RelBE toxin-antitoxin system
MNVNLITELPSFTKKAEKIFNKEELSELREFLKDNPEKGDVIPATGGLRKMRWASGGKGKRGGSRVIYFYHVVGANIYLLTCYEKSRKEDISNDEKKQLRKLIEMLIN